MKKMFCVFAALTVMSTFGVQEDTAALKNALKAIHRCDPDAVLCEVTKLAETCSPTSLQIHLKMLLGEIDEAIMANKMKGNPRYHEQHALGINLLVWGCTAIGCGFYLDSKCSVGPNKSLR